MAVCHDKTLILLIADHISHTFHGLSCVVGRIFRREEGVTVKALLVILVPIVVSVSISIATAERDQNQTRVVFVPQTAQMTSP